jgi:hypothetical protein
MVSYEISMPSRRDKQLNIHVQSPRCDFDIQRTWACVDEEHFDSLCKFDLVFHYALWWFPPTFEFISERGITPFLLYQIVRDKKKVSVKIFKVNVVKIDTRWCFSSTQFQHDSLVAGNMYVEDENFVFIMLLFVWY